MSSISIKSGLDSRRRGRLRDCPPPIRPRRGSAPHRAPVFVSPAPASLLPLPPPRPNSSPWLLLLLRPRIDALTLRRPTTPAATLPLPLPVPLPLPALLPQNGARRSLPASPSSSASSSWSTPPSEHTFLCSRCAAAVVEEEAVPPPAPVPSPESLRRPTNAYRFAAAGSSVCARRLCKDTRRRTAVGDATIIPYYCMILSATKQLGAIPKPNTNRTLYWGGVGGRAQTVCASAALFTRSKRGGLCSMLLYTTVLPVSHVARAFRGDKNL